MALPLCPTHGSSPSEPQLPSAHISQRLGAARRCARPPRLRRSRVPAPPAAACAESAPNHCQSGV